MLSKLPIELKYKILSYLPIIDEKVKIINHSIRQLHKMILILSSYSISFNTDSFEPNDTMISLSISWFYTDLTYFLNDYVNTQEKINTRFSDFLYKVTHTHIASHEELLELEENYSSLPNLLIDSIVHMTELELYNFWKYVQHIYQYPDLRED